MRTLLMLLFSAILIAMLVITTAAQMQRHIVDAVRDLIADRWFQATLFDAYFGFVTFYVWVAYKERQAWSRVVWFILVMCLGNIAMSIYVLIQLIRLPSQASLNDLLLANHRVGPVKQDDL